MPDVVGRVHRPRIGLEGAKPLAERWAQTVELLNRLAPNTAIPVPVSEANIDLMTDLIVRAQAAKAPPPMDEHTRAAAQEYWEHQRQWNAAALEIRNAQSRLLWIKDAWQHRLLKDISPNCFETPGSFDVSAGSGPNFRNATEARQAARELEPHLRRLYSVREQIRRAESFDSQPAGERAIALVEALYTRQADLHSRIEKLEAAAMAAEARLDRLERQHKPKNKRSKPSKRSTNIGTKA